MSTAALAALVAAIVGSAVTAVGLWLSRRSAREADRTQRRLVDLNTLSATVEALNGQVSHLEGALDDAEAKVAWLNAELAAAQHNVLVLSNHIRRYLPEQPFPELQRMNRGI
jgi:peptidoglycan hydrolase CwlO-like protein